MLDSIQIKNRLAQRGFTDEQAEGLASEFTGFTESNLATSGDLKDLRKDMDNQFAQMKGRFGWWALYIVLGNAAVTAALLALYGFAA